VDFSKVHGLQSPACDFQFFHPKEFTMNFPMQSPVYQFLYWLVNTPSVGSAIVGLVILGAVGLYALSLRNIVTARSQDGDAYAYPTPALHHHEEE